MTKTGLEKSKPTRRPLGPELPEKEEKERKTPLRPSEKRRRSRQLSVTFTSSDVPERLRELALEWGMYGPDGKSPAISTVVEYLLLPRLKQAEGDELGPPPRGWRASRRT